MARWILDTNILIYHITGDETFGAAVGARIKQAEDEGHDLYVPAAVVAEVLYVLEDAEHGFGFTREEAVRAIEQVLVSESVQCQDDTAVLYGLERHRERNLDFVDGYCAGLAKEPEVVLITNDGDIAKKTDGQVEGLTAADLHSVSRRQV